MLNSCTNALKALPPFFLTVSMMEKIVQKLEWPSAERKEPATFIFSLLILKLFSPILLEKGTLKSVKNLSTSSFSSLSLSMRFRTFSFFGLPRFFTFGAWKGFLEKALSSILSYCLLKSSSISLGAQPIPFPMSSFFVL